jgi:hypothetical protein
LYYYGNSWNIVHTKHNNISTRNCYYSYIVVLYIVKNCVVVGAHMGRYRSSCCTVICDDGGWRWRWRRRCSETRIKSVSCVLFIEIAVCKCIRKCKIWSYLGYAYSSIKKINILIKLIFIKSKWKESYPE